MALERETALLIVSPDAATIADRVAVLTDLAGFALTAGPTQTIRDLYLDTADGLLAARRLALRVRAIGDDRWITLKGPARATSWGRVEWAELE
ncbi:MAG: CYTH domain-containing protein [Armatimonadota bacterium]|nr:CYTH domain-containing protein [Armatimonadota bacterium]